MVGGDYSVRDAAGPESDAVFRRRARRRRVVAVVLPRRPKSSVLSRIFQWLGTPTREWREKYTQWSTCPWTQAERMASFFRAGLAERFFRAESLPARRAVAGPDRAVSAPEPGRAHFGLRSPAASAGFASASSAATSSASATPRPPRATLPPAFPRAVGRRVCGYYSTRRAGRRGRHDAVRRP